MSYPVDSAISSNLIALVFYVPSNLWYMNACTGQLLELTMNNAWDENSFVSPDTIADFGKPNWENIQFMQILTGQIIPYPLNQMEYINRDPAQGASGLLPCDGGLYSVVSYPNLYALIGNTFGGDSTVFGTPDLRGRAALNADDMGTPQGAAGVNTDALASSPGGSGGDEFITLDVTEIPSHTHTNSPHTHTLTPHTHGYSSAAPNATTIGPGAPQPTAVPLPAATAPASDGITATSVTIDSTGGGNPHLNMQPWSVAFYYIVAY